MRIVIVTDAWSPQVNGVVRTLLTIKGERRVDTASVNKRAVEHLIKAGAFDALVQGHEGDRGTRRNLLLTNLETAMKWGAAQRE